MEIGIFFLLISNFIFIYCQNNTRNIEINSSSIIDIDVLQISYELAYKESYSLVVIIKTINDLDFSVSFPAKLKSVKSKLEFNLNCHNVSVTEIECYTEKDVKFDLKDKYYFYYNRGEKGKYTMEENDIYEDFKQVNLIFKPEMYTDLIMYKDHRKVIGLNNRKIVGGGYLYLARKNKKLLHKPADGFNQNLELNNFIIHGGITSGIPPCTLASYKEAINRGYLLVDANLQFTQDKIPIICNQDNLENINGGKGKINEISFSNLQKIDLGTKFDKRYKNEKILSFEELLKLCKENNIIIDLNLSHLDFQKYFENTNDYSKAIIDIIEKYDMFNSIIFEEGTNDKIISKLIELKNYICVSISNINSIQDMENMKNKYPNSKRIIYNIGNIAANKIDKKTIKYGLSLGKKIKVSDVIDDINIAKDLLSLGVNFITTNKLEPFLIDNEYEWPILLRCNQFDILVDCRLGKEIKLYDNAVYNIYYTKNIYNLYEDIVDKPIGEFKYLDTKQLDDRFYKVKKFDFEKGDIDLDITFAIKVGKKLRGKVGPDYDNVKDCYLYDFSCDGNNLLNISCKIDKNNKTVKFNGNYTIHSIDYYSWNKTVPLVKTNSIFGNINENNKLIYFSTVLFIIIATCVVIFIIFKGKNKKDFSKIKIDDKTFK